ncbi:MAG: SulP family inorganic anion transporter, partial [Chromatiales bacterium]
MFSVLKTALKARPNLESLRSDVLAGLTVGVIALPLSMALAIASGAPPQHGLYTAVVAGVVIALAGGSPVNISGPTAAFVVILLPITQTYGLGGLLISGMMAGVILVAMGLARLGGLIEVVPYPVTIGFTAGIGVVIAVLQIPDLLGLSLGPLSGQFTDKLAGIAGSLATVHWPDLLIGALTLGILVFWCRLRSKVPAHLVALLLGSVAAVLGGWLDGGFQVATIGSRFTYEEAGVLHGGIPPI